MAMHINMFGSVDKFALMQFHFYLAGEIMGHGGLSKRIVAWVLSIIGGVRGSLALTTVGTCTVFGAISGSSPATVAAVGRLLYGPLRNAGYNEKFSSGLLASSGAIASVIPPSIGMILYGASAEQSVACYSLRVFSRPFDSWSYGVVHLCLRAADGHSRGSRFLVQTIPHS